MISLQKIETLFPPEPQRRPNKSSFEFFSAVFSGRRVFWGHLILTYANPGDRNADRGAQPKNLPVILRKYVRLHYMKKSPVKQTFLHRKNSTVKRIDKESRSRVILNFDDLV
jgi:hypothetical protein